VSVVVMIRLAAHALVCRGPRLDAALAARSIVVQLRCGSSPSLKAAMPGDAPAELRQYLGFLKHVGA